MDIGEKLHEAMNSKVMFNIELFDIKIPVTDTVVVMWIIMAAIMIISVILTRNMKMVPEGRQNLIEAAVDFINNICRNNIGHDWRRFAPYLGTMAFFLMFANLASLLNILPEPEWLAKVTGLDFFRKIPYLEIKPPTQNINTTAALAIMSIITVIIGGIVVKGPGKWLKGFVEPVPIILPFKIIDYLIRPVSLCLRLFGNIMGAFIVMTLLYIALPAFIPAAASIYFDIFDGLIQMYVFVFLTSFYIAESVE